MLLGPRLGLTPWPRPQPAQPQLRPGSRDGATGPSQEREPHLSRARAASVGGEHLCPPPTPQGCAPCRPCPDSGNGALRTSSAPERGSQSQYPAMAKAAGQSLMAGGPTAPPGPRRSAHDSAQGPDQLEPGRPGPVCTATGRDLSGRAGFRPRAARPLLVEPFPAEGCRTQGGHRLPSPAGRDGRDGNGSREGRARMHPRPTPRRGRPPRNPRA